MASNTPRGFRDILPDEASWRESITEDVQECFASWGYMPIETPALEVVDTLDIGGGISHTPISLFDSDGRLLALRPDVTLPIARMVASRLADKPGPFRFRYCEQVFRQEESLRAQERGFTQLGVESIGLSGDYADAEVISLFVEALRACGLPDFNISICTVGVLREIIAGAGMDASWREAVLEAYHATDVVSLDRLAAAPGVKPGFGEALSRLIRIRGGREAIRECRGLAEALGCPDGLESLERTWDILEAAGTSAQVSVDFSVMSSFDYYTGLVMKAYAPGFGLSLGSGGRYDKMLASYGRNLPAAGFAFSLERVMGALAAQGSRTRERHADVLVGGPDMGNVFKVAAALRRQGYKVCITGQEDVVKTARERGIPNAYETICDGSARRMIGGDA